MCINVLKLEIPGIHNLFQFIHMNGVLDFKPSTEDIEHYKFWVYLQIYLRKNETFFIKKFYLVTGDHHNNNAVLFWNCTKVLCLACDSFGQSEVQVRNHQQITKIFSLFVCLRTLEILLRKWTYFLKAQI